MGCVSASDPIMRQCSGVGGWGGGGGRKGRGGGGEVRTLPQSKFCPTRQTSSLRRLSSIKCQQKRSKNSVRPSTGLAEKGDRECNDSGSGGPDQGRGGGEGARPGLLGQNCCRKTQRNFSGFNLDQLLVHVCTK